LPLQQLRPLKLQPKRSPLTQINFVERHGRLAFGLAFVFCADSAVRPKSLGLSIPAHQVHWLSHPRIRLEFMIVIDDIISVADNVKKLEHFIEGDLPGILNSFAEVEYKAAADALQNISLAKNRKGMVMLAVGHLQSAHASYQKLAEPSGFKDMAKMATRMAVVHKDLFTLTLMAVCYRYLGEARLMEKTLADAVNLLANDIYEKTYTLGELVDPKQLKAAAHDVFSAMASWVNPATYPIAWQQAHGTFPAVKREQMARLCKALKYDPGVALPASG
jgi:hypothetical protein